MWNYHIATLSVSWKFGAMHHYCGAILEIDNCNLSYLRDVLKAQVIHCLTKKALTLHPGPKKKVTPRLMDDFCENKKGEKRIKEQRFQVSTFLGIPVHPHYGLLIHAPVPVGPGLEGGVRVGKSPILVGEWTVKMNNKSQMQDAETNVRETSIASTSRAIAPQPMAPAEKAKKFTSIDFKRWQQKMFFYLTTLCLQKLTSEDAPETKLVKLVCIYCDSQAAIGRAESMMYNGKSHHIRQRCNTIRELLSSGIITIDYVKSKDKLLDPLKKGLSREEVERISKGIGLRPRIGHHGGNST
ncbi:hypothetical protein T459_12373 [Capsicum annuum]|uniref:Uncharacterized protein n=1 Tax=Capsicum annuum TaxID=4072 RepID=A0A2G2ZPL2_CAPAN|nr:hypothetical protein T459_12373 [Capsicum annuum]